MMIKLSTTEDAEAKTLLFVRVLRGGALS